MSIFKKNQDLQKKVEVLLRENKNLRKKLSKFRKASSKNVNYSKETKPKLNEKIDNEKIKECNYCHGEIRDVSIYNLKFEVCQKCKTRTRIK